MPETTTFNQTFTLHPDSSLGTVHLTVSNLERSVDFYQRSIGLQLHQGKDDKAFLGTGGDDLLVLKEVAGAQRVSRRTGLYHFALLVSSRLELARSLRNLIETDTGITGGADHLASEAIYLDDPDGNGIELYSDRPRSEWQYVDGRVQMATDPLDYQGILGELSRAPGPRPSNHHKIDPDTVLGHMHLHVAHLDQAAAFYEQVIGFELQGSYPGFQASFLSAGGYHHHIGVNTWAGVGAPPSPANAIGLRYFTINIPEEGELIKLMNRLEQAGIPIEDHKAGLMVRDPSQNKMAFTVPADASRESGGDGADGSSTIGHA
jgi:catechol 2,3-dioxygenase